MKIISPNNLDPKYPKESSRSYLNSFFSDGTCLLFTDNNINRIADIHDYIIGAGKIDFILIDITHNVVGLKQNQFNTTCRDITIRNIEELVEHCCRYAPTAVTHCDFNYQPTTPNYFYFPVWLWMWSAKNPLWYRDLAHQYGQNPVFYDIEENKNMGMLCMNRTPNWHRILFFNALIKKPWLSKISYTFGNHGHGKKPEDAYYFLTADEIAEFENKRNCLPFILINDDREDTTDVGISHPAWSTHTFNLVTESAMDNTLLSEKTCKPFVSKMIPIILGPKNTARHLQEAGLDMFGDIVPWHTWDDLPEPRQRIAKVVEFLDSFLEHDLVAIYHANKHRVDRNKEFFHSEQFRNNITKDMLKLSSNLKID